MAVIFILSDQPHLTSGLGVWDIVGRKFLHAAEYCLLTFLWARALRWRIVPAVAITFLYAISDEYHQNFVAGRNGSPIDVLIDGVGIVLGSLLVKRRKKN